MKTLLIIFTLMIVSCNHHKNYKEITGEQETIRQTLGFVEDKIVSRTKQLNAKISAQDSEIINETIRFLKKERDRLKTQFDSLSALLKK